MLIHNDSQFEKHLSLSKNQRDSVLSSLKNKCFDNCNISVENLALNSDELQYVV